MLGFSQSSTSFKLPVQLAIRLVLDGVGYTNCLPYWLQPAVIDYSSREFLVQDRVHQYSNGTTPPTPFFIQVPKRSGGRRFWALPSINDQIILQACISTFAERLEAKYVGSNVYSYRVNRIPDRAAFISDQLDSWITFQDVTKKRCASSDGCLLQFDLEEAFRNIDRDQLYAFLSDICDEQTLNILRAMLEAFSYGPGVPLINDSVFFLGNAFLSKIDAVVRRHVVDFIRFVDDYRVFGSSTQELEIVCSRISRDLEQLGFKLNTTKTRVGTATEFLELLSSGGEDDTQSDYINPVVLRGSVSGESLAQSIVMAVSDPERYLNEGFGRLQLGMISRLRFVEQVAEEQRLDTTRRSELGWALGKNRDFVSRCMELLESYSKSDAEAWRAVWLLYVIQELEAAREEWPRLRLHSLEALVKKIRSDVNRPEIVRLWSRKQMQMPTMSEIEALHDLDYLKAGIALHNGRTS